MQHVEHITWNGKSLAYIIQTEIKPNETTFLTHPEANFQVGFVVYPSGGEITRHEHPPSERHIMGHSEMLLIKKGMCEVDIYNNDQKLVATRELREGDVLLIVDGGHGFRMLEDTIILEVKQGPYMGSDQRRRF